jgi:hypothetical protein
MWSKFSEALCKLMKEKFFVSLTDLNFSQEETAELTASLAKRNKVIQENWEKTRREMRGNGPELLNSMGEQLLYNIAMEILSKIESRCAIVKKHAEDKWMNAVADTFNNLMYYERYVINMWFLHSNPYREYDKQPETISILENALREAHFRSHIIIMPPK